MWLRVIPDLEEGQEHPQQPHRPRRGHVGLDSRSVFVVSVSSPHSALIQWAAREEKEAGVMKALKAGGDILGLSGIGMVLEAKGCTFA